VSGATWRQKPALWNEARDGIGRYQAPAGYVIKSAVPRVQSEARSSSQVNISADKREVTLSVHVRGSGNFVDKKRDWFQGYNLRAPAGLQLSALTLVPGRLGTWKWRPQLIPRPGPFPFQMPASRRN